MDKEKLLLELQSNPKVQEYLSGFEEESVKQFLENYVSKKEMLLQFGEDWRNMQHGSIGYFRACAEEYYWAIAQKKLFNLQCLWRAEQIDLPVETTWEFSYWGENIKNCPFIEETTEQEIEAMIHYLEQTSYEDDEILNWQEYDEFKDEKTGIGTSDSYPEWYHFYDIHFSTSHVTLLPDLVGKMEEKYLSAWRDKAFSEVEDTGHRKPHLFSDQETTEDFIRKVEPYKILEYYRLEREFVERSEFMERLENQLQILKEEEEGEVYMPEGKFPDAIFQAVHILKVSKIKQLLPEIHQSHLERRALGISYTEEDRIFQFDLAQTMKERINEGKRLLGEE